MLSSGSQPQGHLYTSEDVWEAEALCGPAWTPTPVTAARFGARHCLQHAELAYPRAYKLQVLLMWGSWQTQGEEGKTGHPCCPAGLTLRPSRQFSQNPSALLACGSLSAFFPFSVSALVAGSPFPQERESPLSLNPLPRDPPIPPSPGSHPFSSYLWVGLPR